MSNKYFFTDHCFCCGSKNIKGLSLVVEKHDEYSLIKCSIPSEYESYPGIVHGGIISTLLDEALWYAFYFKNLFTFTRKLSITFKKSVPVNYPIMIKGEVIKKLRASLWIGKAEIFDNNKNLFAFATGEFFESKNLENKLAIYFKES
ncbi:MAG: PaaI family thioesterase [Proteobacteria bacterium]|nr:PaaI family thioesterase [Pseudomonadota bacterium]